MSSHRYLSTYFTKYLYVRTTGLSKINSIIISVQDSEPTKRGPQVMKFIFTDHLPQLFKLTDTKDWERVGIDKGEIECVFMSFDHFLMLCTELFDACSCYRCKALPSNLSSHGLK